MTAKEASTFCGTRKARKIARILVNQAPFWNSDDTSDEYCIRVADGGGYTYASPAESGADYLDETLMTFRNAKVARSFVFRALGVAL